MTNSSPSNEIRSSSSLCSLTNEEIPRKRCALSASRAKDYKQCPLLFRYRVIDRLPEPVSPDAIRGTLIHAVLEKQFDFPAPKRSIELANQIIIELWAQMRPNYLNQNNQPLFGSVNPEIEEAEWIEGAKQLLKNYFEIENPQRLEPRAREHFVEVTTKRGLLLRGFIDRIDVSPNGLIRVIDYKSGKSPKPAYHQDALYQMYFYALLLKLQKHRIPARMQLIYLRDGNTLAVDPSDCDIEDFQDKLHFLWEEIKECARSENFPPRKTPLCPWCNFQTHCPLFGGEIPLMNSANRDHLLGAEIQQVVK